MNPATAVSERPAAFHPASSPDFVPREPLAGLQTERLRRTVARAYEHVPLVRQRMHKQGLSPADVTSPEDLARLPFTTKADLDGAFPLGMAAVPMQQIAALYSAGGFAGQTAIGAYTAADLEVWTELAVRALASCGIRPGDVLLAACGYHLFADGLGLHYGAAALGATVMPVTGTEADQQIAAMQDIGVSAVCSTPSYFLHLVERAEKTGVDLRRLPLRIGAFVSEPWNEATRRRIEESAGIKAFDVLGLSAAVGPTVGAECAQQNGVHIFEDHFFPEIVDPDSGQPLPEGQEGELVLTTLSREAMPVLRYRTGDLTAILPGACPCGRSMRRIRRIDRHGEDQFVVQGVSLFPSQIESVLVAVEGTLPCYQIVLTEEAGEERIEVQVEVTPQILSDRVSAMEGLEATLAEQIHQTVGIEVGVRLVEPHTLSGGQTPVQRVVDKRND